VGYGTSMALTRRLRDSVVLIRRVRRHRGGRMALRTTAALGVAAAGTAVVLARRYARR
jgi:hypothetical protein